MDRSESRWGQKCKSSGHYCGLTFLAINFWWWISHLYSNHKFGFTVSILFCPSALQKKGCPTGLPRLMSGMCGSAGNRLLCFSFWVLIKSHPPSTVLQISEIRAEKTAIYSVWLQIPTLTEHCKDVNAFCMAPTQSCYRFSLSQARQLVALETLQIHTATSCAKHGKAAAAKHLESQQQN